MPSFAFESSLEFARSLDSQDSLARYRSEFHFPRHQGTDAIYFCGNSLGLQPKRVEAAIGTELQSWQEVAVGGYFGGTPETFQGITVQCL